MKRGIRVVLILAVLAVILAIQSARADTADPPEVTIGERLFLETRFAQFFFTNSHGNVNTVLPTGDPVMDTTETTTGGFTGPFAGQSMNCRACHLVDEHGATTGGGNRTYCDFARRSPIPAREDGKTHTPRNSPPLVNATLHRPGGMLLHFDGEFSSTADLVKGTFTGRNFGWLPAEGTQALAHIVRVIREDDGTGALAQNYSNLSYRVLFKGTDPSIPQELRLPARFLVNVDKASDARVLNAVAKLVAAYTESLVFAQDENGEFSGSPYDVFLKKNGLPRQPVPKEANLLYARRLRGLIDALANPVFVTWSDGTFAFHSQAFQFGPQELDGLKIFLAEPPVPGLSQTNTATSRIGNCLACHAPPTFTDFHFHNTGATQQEYDALHGAGAFAALDVPDAVARRADFDAFLPATAKHPNAHGPFLAIPSAEQAGVTDLGLWNVFGNPDEPRPQARLRRLLRQDHPQLKRTELLPLTVGLFKTPGLRDLADSGPYLHTGAKDTLEDVIQFYRDMSDLERDGQLRNGDSRLGGITLSADDTAALKAFLDSLTEDYN